MDHFSQTVRKKLDAIRDDPNLTKLNLSCSELRSIPPELAQNENITELVMCGNRIERIDCLPPNLKLLDLSQNMIKRVDPGSIPASCTSIDLSGNCLIDCSNFPDGVMSLDLTDNVIEEADLSGYPHLSVVDLSNNKLPEMPNLPDGVTSLDLQNNSISEVNMGDWPSNLQVCNISYNTLTVLDHFPSQLTELECYCNLLTRIDGLDDTLLTKFDASNNSLTEFPSLPSTTTEIDLSHNDIEKVSKDDIPFMTTQMNLSNNKLTSKPEVDATVDLDISNNGLSDDDDDDDEGIVYAGGTYMTSAVNSNYITNTNTTTGTMYNYNNRATSYTPDFSGYSWDSYSPKNPNILHLHREVTL